MYPDDGSPFYKEACSGAQCIVNALTPATSIVLHSAKIWIYFDKAACRNIATAFSPFRFAVLASRWINVQSANVIYSLLIARSDICDRRTVIRPNIEESYIPSRARDGNQGPVANDPIFPLYVPYVAHLNSLGRFHLYHL